MTGWNFQENKKLKTSFSKKIRNAFLVITSSWKILKKQQIINFEKKLCIKLVISIYHVTWWITCTKSKIWNYYNMKYYQLQIEFQETWYVQCLAVKLAICQLWKNKCCCRLGQHKSLVNISFESTYRYL